MHSLTASMCQQAQQPMKLLYVRLYLHTVCDTMVYTYIHFKCDAVKFIVVNYAKIRCYITFHQNCHGNSQIVHFHAIKPNAFPKRLLA